MTILQAIATQKNNSRRNTIKIKKKKKKKKERKNNPQTHNHSLVALVSELIEMFQRAEHCDAFMCLFVCVCVCA